MKGDRYAVDHWLFYLSAFFQRYCNTDSSYKINISARSDSRGRERIRTPVFIRKGKETLHCDVHFAASWIDASRFESALRDSVGPHASPTTSVTLHFPIGCKVMVDGAVRILSLANQLHSTTRRVRLEFAEGESGTMGYLNRMGFFDHLHPSIDVVPVRPVVSGAMLYRGSNSMLLEIASINKDVRDINLPGRLADVVGNACSGRADVTELKGAAWTIFAELIDNIFSHSGTELNGYAALQVYSGGNRLAVAVSDSGLGIMQTLRPTLQAESPKLAGLSDTDLLVEIFRQGLSRHGADRGCGLKGCAAKAIKFSATLDVRLPTQRVLLTPARGAYVPNTAHCYDGLPLLWGTHMVFMFGLSA